MPNNKSSINNDINIMGKTYSISCSPEEKDNLCKAAKYLNDKMHELKNINKTATLEKIAIITALNISYELINQQTNPDLKDNDIQQQLTAIINQINKALNV